MSKNMIHWNTDVGLIPNHEGTRVRVLVRDVGSIVESCCVVATDADGRRFLSADGTAELPVRLVIAWRSRSTRSSGSLPVERCSWCKDTLLVGSRLRDDGMCGPCSRLTRGEMTVADALRYIGAL